MARDGVHGAVGVVRAVGVGSAGCGSVVCAGVRGAVGVGWVSVAARGGAVSGGLGGDLALSLRGPSGTVTCSCHL